jgi:hypothetical protein
VVDSLRQPKRLPRLADHGRGASPSGAMPTALVTGTSGLLTLCAAVGPQPRKKQKAHLSVALIRKRFRWCRSVTEEKRSCTVISPGVLWQDPGRITLDSINPCGCNYLHSMNVSGGRSV